MKVLMFGWEFPPHISGGLGTACYGLTKSMTKIPETEVLFVVPKAYGDEEQFSMKVLGANDIYIDTRKLVASDYHKKFTLIEVSSRLVPYVSPEEFENMTFQTLAEKMGYEIGMYKGKFNFTGKYGKSLYKEISDYAVVAAAIALENDFDIIHAHDWLTYPAGIAAKTISGKPLVIHVHATDFDRSGGNVNPAVYEIEKKGMEVADKIITVSNLTRNTVIYRYGIDPKKVVTVYNAVDHVDYSDFKIMDKPFDEKIVTFLGRITLQKGPEYFIEAANKVLKKMDNVRFVMAGSGDMMNKMVTHVAKLKISDRFHFTGFLKGDDVYQMFAWSDVYVMPSVSEPFGISPLEAMQSSVPVIISRQSGVSEILHHAIKVDFWDIDAMADAIYGILNYSALGKTFKNYGKVEVDNLKWDNSAQKVREVYSSVLENN
jgi:glycosyltransferase involved in cell wall biosynthesis